MRTKTLAAFALVVLALASLSLAWTSGQARTDVVPAGTSIDVRLDAEISTEDAHPGDSWSGTVNQSVVSGDRMIIPAGSPVMGVVTTAAQGTHKTRAQLGLTVRRVTMGGRSYEMNADTPTIVAGSHRAKKIGAIAGGAVAGALIGHTVAKERHGTLIGGLVGGAAGYGLTRHAFRTLELKSGTVVSFTTREALVARR